MGLEIRKFLKASAEDVCIPVPKPEFGRYAYCCVGLSWFNFLHVFAYFFGLVVIDPGGGEGEWALGEDYMYRHG